MHAATATANVNSLTVIAAVRKTIASELPKQQSPPIINLIRQRLHSRRPFYGLEVIPQTRHPSDVLDLNTFNEWPPLFISVGWIGERVQCVAEMRRSSPALRLAHSLKEADVPVLSHLSCAQLSADTARQLISENVLALRGDKVHAGQPFQHAIELVQLIREHSAANTTCIAVGAYPDVHPTATSADSDLEYLRRKVEAGADVIITQLCFSAVAILRFIERCRAIGIRVPIVVGIYVPNSWSSLQRMCELCEIRIDDDALLARYRAHAGDEIAFRANAVRQTRAMMRTLLDGGVEGFQFFTLNRFEVVQRCVDGFGF